MVRTKANASSVRISAAKAPRKYTAPACRSTSSLTSPSSKKEKSVGGNLACPRPTPVWQKSVASFFNPASRQVLHASEHNEERPESNEKLIDQANNELYHDDKENRNPEDNRSLPNLNEDDDEPGPSNRIASGTKSKRRKILIMDSDSEEEIPAKGYGCVAEIEDEISVS